MSLMLNSNSDDNETLYSDSVFSTYLYTGNGSTQTINNGIDLAGKGGMVWSATRVGAENNGPEIIDTNRGGSYRLLTSTTQAAYNCSDPITFNNNGFSMSPTINTYINYSGYSKVAWTFRKAAKFFDIVTWTGDGNTYPATRTLNHSLGIAPGMIVIKVTSAVDDWVVYHAAAPTPTSKYLRLNTTEAQISGTVIDQVTSTSFRITDQLAYGADSLNQLNQTYVAYVFAHNTAADGIIQCGSYTGTSAAENAINLGWEPQYVMIKCSSATASWNVYDSMRGVPTGNNDNFFLMDTSVEQSTGTTLNDIDFTATGFTLQRLTTRLNTSGQTYIYMAIRRPNKPPTSGAQVFSANLVSSPADTKITTGIPLDLLIARYTLDQTGYIFSRALGMSTISTSVTENYLASNTTSALNTSPPGFTYNWVNNGFNIKAGYANAPVSYLGFTRAPGFFDVVCDTGKGTTLNSISHNLGVKPELIIRKPTSELNSWWVYHKGLADINSFLTLQSSQGAASDSTAALWGNAQPTSTTFNVGYNTTNYDNKSGVNYVTYLFATLAGVSKVGSYTGNGGGQAIDCGFAAGARFILIKCISTTGDWYVWDTARGIVTGNDPYYLLNTTYAQVTTNDSIDPNNTGFIVNQVAATNINVLSATYIFLAIS